MNSRQYQGRYLPDTLPGALQKSIIVSCQPVVGGPMDKTPIVAAMALAAVQGGAGGLRVESPASVSAVRNATSLPIIGLVKRDLTDSRVRITPLPGDVEALVEAGADIVAYDATQRERPVPTAQILRHIHDLGALAMADCARLEDGQQALAEGADILGTTLSGYAYVEATAEAGPDFELVQRFAYMDTFVIAEGRIRTPGEAADAIGHGADTVVVGSAVTRIEHITAWFSQAIADRLANGKR